MRTVLRQAWIVVVALAVAGCAASNEPTVDADLRLIVADGHVRTEGAECAGTGPFRRIHAGSEYTLEDGNGEVVTEGELPAGSAHNADPDVEWRTERMPTYCVIDVTIPDVPERSSYRLHLAAGNPLEFEREHLEHDGPLPMYVD